MVEKPRHARATLTDSVASGTAGSRAGSTHIVIREGDAMRRLEPDRDERLPPLTAIDPLILSYENGDDEDDEDDEEDEDDEDDEEEEELEV
jgi:hypothetical protein